MYKITRGLESRQQPQRLADGFLWCASGGCFTTLRHVKTAEFDYHLPAELIAQHPAPQREASRMLVVHRAESRLEHRCFAELGGFLEPGDLLVMNNTRVIPARVYGHKAGTGGRIELLFLEDLGGGRWDVLLRSRRRPVVGARLELADGQAEAVLLEDREMGRAVVRVSPADNFPALLDRIGETPLPPYIKRAGDEYRQPDRERYQTIYASVPGAVAAPTAGLHFTPEVLERLARNGVRKAEVTLHVGLGTFRPVEVADIEAHRMEEERYEVPEATAALIAETRRAGRRVMAVGSTSVRTLETVAGEDGTVRPGSGRSGLFIYPGYRFRVVDAMLTNFHLPRSTLIMMICAFAGRELIMKAYEEAVREKYRFYSYGDCMLIV